MYPTTFASTLGLYHFKQIQFGLTNTPVTMAGILCARQQQEVKTPGHSTGSEWYRQKFINNSDLNRSYTNQCQTHVQTLHQVVVGATE